MLPWDEPLAPDQKRQKLFRPGPCPKKRRTAPVPMSTRLSGPAPATAVPSHTAMLGHVNLMPGRAVKPQQTVSMRHIDVSARTSPDVHQFVFHVFFWPRKLAPSLAVEPGNDPSRGVLQRTDCKYRIKTEPPKCEDNAPSAEERGPTTWHTLKWSIRPPATDPDVLSAATPNVG